MRIAMVMRVGINPLPPVVGTAIAPEQPFDLAGRKLVKGIIAFLIRVIDRA